MAVKKEKGKIVEIGWKGDFDLAQKLNSDSALNKQIVERSQMTKGLIKMIIWYEPKYNYAFIYHSGTFISKPEDFEIMNMIAKHIKSAWFGR